MNTGSLLLLLLLLELCVVYSGSVNQGSWARSQASRMFKIET